MRGYGPSTYGDAFASVYDTWYEDIGDVEGCVLAVAAAAAGGAVLELGVGTGRLALPLRDAGVAVVGVDASPAMLATLRAKAGADAIPLIQGDLTHLPLRGRFAGAIIAFNTLFNLTTSAAQEQLFAEVARLLAPGGFLAAELFVPETEQGAPDAVVEPSRIEIDRVVLTASVRDRERQLVEGQHIEITASGIVLHPWAIRYAAPDELDAMAAAAGLVLEHRAGGWRGEPFDTHTEQHISWWRKPPSKLRS